MGNKVIEEYETGEPKIIKTGENSPHYAKKLEKDGTWIKFISKPGNKNNRTTSSKHTIQKIMKKREWKEKPFCFFCGRHKDELGYNETLTIDHIKELSNGGEDRVKNLQILCTKCHKQKNHTRTYITWHLIREKPYKAGGEQGE